MHSQFQKQSRSQPQRKTLSRFSSIDGDTRRVPLAGGRGGDVPQIGSMPRGSKFHRREKDVQLVEAGTFLSLSLTIYIYIL